MNLGKVIDIYELKRKGYKIEDTSKRDTIICLSAILVSQVSFSTIVNLLYPILGILGLFELVLI